ncbi:MAG: iron ABC transporter permease [Clostridiaceae bacterium]|nr:iron ABC transporter permease [Clostridiaceae bacterium]
MTNSSVLKHTKKAKQKKIILLFLLFVLLTSVVISLIVGSAKLSLADVLSIFQNQAEKTSEMILLNIRLPRIVTAIIVGAMLAISGLIMQCVVNNPLASPSTLGVAQGAAFGAAIGIVVFGGGVVTTSPAPIEINNPQIVTLSAFVFSMLSTIVILAVSHLFPHMEASGLVLVGIALNSLYTAGSTLIQYFADDVQLGAVVFWTFGNVGGTNWNEILLLGIVLLLAYLFFFYHKWDYFAIDAGTDVAKSVGVETRFLTLASMTICSIATAIAVSLVGVISFIGLISPHLMRRLIGSDYRYLLPATALGGSLILLIADTVGRLIISPIILPVGAITSLLGAPMFIFIFLQGARRND